MRHGVRFGVGIGVFIGFMAALGFDPSTSLASETNVFVVKNTLQAGAPTASGVKLLKFKSNADAFLGTNATSSSTKLAVAVMDTDCQPGGLNPKIQLVAFNRTTSKIVATLVDFTTIAPIFIGDDEIVMQAAGEGRNGVDAANLDAFITLRYKACASTTNATDPISVEINPLGFIRPTGTVAGSLPILPDSGSLEIVTDDPNNPDISVPLTGKGAVPTLICKIDVESPGDFGSVNLGTNRVQTLTILNNGGIACAVNDITLNGSSAFSISAPSTPFSVAAGASVVATITFTPVIIGVDSTVVRVTSTDPSQAITNVALTGTGVVMPAECSLSVSPLSRNFGDVEVGSNKTLNVTLSNSGGSTCVVDGITLATNLVGFSVSPSAPLLVPPGTSVVVAVTFTPDLVTNATGTLEIDSLAPTNLALVTLSAAGVAAPCHLTIDLTSVNFGGLSIGGSRTQTVALANVGVTNCMIDLLPITNATFTVIFPATNSFDIAAGSSTNVDIVFMPTDNGTTNGALLVVSDNPPMTNTVALSGLGVMPVANCDIIASPASLDFGDVAAGHTDVLKTKVSDVGLAGCLIREITFSGSAEFALIAPAVSPTNPIALGPNGFIEVGVAYSPTNVSSDVGIIGIVSEDESNTVIEVPVSGNGVQPTLSISTTNVAFGSVPVGSTNTVSVFVTNVGTVPATVTSISPASGNLRFDDEFVPTHFILSPGDMVEIPVIYTPSDRGDDSGTLTINSDDPNSPLRATLSGTGLQCNVSVALASIDFHTVAIGRTNSVTLSITNSGNTNCVVESLEIVGSGRFELVAPATPFVIGPETNVDVQVEYLPANVQTIVILGGRLRTSGRPTPVTP